MPDCPSCNDKKNRTIIHSNGVIKRGYIKKDNGIKKPNADKSNGSVTPYVIKRKK